MTLLTRISRLFRADFHALLDNVEEPDVLLRQAVREMEEELLCDERQEQRLLTELDNLNTRRVELENTLSGISEELDICLTAEREQLARSLIKRRLESERLLERLTQQANSVEKALTDLHVRLKDQRERLEALRQKAALFEDEQRKPFSDSNHHPTVPSVSEDEVEIALLKEKQRRMPS